MPFLKPLSVREMRGVEERLEHSRWQLLQQEENGGSQDGLWRGEEDDHVLKFYLPCFTDVFFTARWILTRVTLPSNGGDPSSSQCQHQWRGWGVRGGDKIANKDRWR